MLFLLVCYSQFSCNKEEALDASHSVTPPSVVLENRGDGSNDFNAPTLSENGYLIFDSEQSFESFQDELFILTQTEGIQQRKQLVDSYMANLGLGSFQSHYDIIHPYIATSLLNGQLPEIPWWEYIGVVEPPFASSISKKGVVQVADTLYIFKGENQVIKGSANTAQTLEFATGLSDSIGVEVPVEEILVTPGIYLEDPLMLTISPSGPSERCPNCPVVGPDTPDGPSNDFDCSFVITFRGGPCDPGRAYVGVSMSDGEFIGSAYIDGDISTTQSFSNNSNEGPFKFEYAGGSFSSLSVGLHDIRIQGTFECYDNGEITQIDETRTITIGTFCGAKRETITTGWDTFDDANNLFRTSFWSEIHYGVFKAKITATGFTSRTINGDWLNVYSDFNFEQYSQWREDDSSCAKRAFHNESDSYTGWFMASVRNTAAKDNRFWVSGEQWVTLQTTGLNAERPGQSELIHHHLTCE